MWEIGRRLKERREAVDLEQGQVAEYEDISKSYISQLESGRNKPNWDLLARLARRYKTSADYILGLIDNPRLAPTESLPLGAQEIIEYLVGMSPRGREQLLKVARILYEDDQDWKQREVALKFLARVASDTEVAPRADELPALLAEFGSLDALARHFAESVTEDISTNQGN